MKILTWLLIFCLFFSQVVFAENTLENLLAPTYRASCCKVCTNSQACGNSCISNSYTCHQPDGCACNANEVGGGDNDSGSDENKPSKPKRPKKLAGAIELAPEYLFSSEYYDCGYIAELGKWLSGKLLDNGKFITLIRLIRNLKKVAKFDDAELTDKIYKTIKELNRKKTQSQLACDALTIP